MLIHLYHQRYNPMKVTPRDTLEISSRISTQSYGRDFGCRFCFLRGLALGEGVLGFGFI